MRLITFLVIALILMPSLVDAKTVVVKVDAQDLVKGSFERGPYIVVNLPIPEDVIGKRLDAVILEVYLDVAADEAVGNEYVPSVEVYPLTETNRGDRAPNYSALHPTSRPVAIGMRQRVQVDISSIVRAWIAQPTTNFGLIIGSFSGPVLDDLDVTNDVLEGGYAIQATFVYQNRFGQRVSSE